LQLRVRAHLEIRKTAAIVFQLVTATLSSKRGIGYRSAE
jgi:hypothetical protein